MNEKWRIDGVPVKFIHRSGAGGNYWVVFDKTKATLTEIEGINWAHPTVVRVDAANNDEGLPDGYGFDVVQITYSSLPKEYVAEIRTAKQFLGDVTGYVAEIEAQQATIAAKTAEIGDLNAQLAEADELAISLYEQLEGGEEAEV